MGNWYCTREDVMSALDYAETAVNVAQVDRAVENASRSIEGQTHRRFYPQAGTRYFRWPDPEAGSSWRVWLDRDEAITVTAVTSNGVPITSYFLEPANAGPPYKSIEVDRSSTAAFVAGATEQRNIAVTGVFGYSADEDPAGATAEALDATETGVDVTDASRIGVGSVLRVDSERMTVTAKGWLTTGQTASLTAASSDVTLTVADGTTLHAGETVLLGAERMAVVDVAGNSASVRRAVDGTVLAVHTTATVYAPRTLTVVRAACGTTAATHLTAAPLFVLAVPVRAWAVAEAINTVLQETSGYARTVGSGDRAANASGAGLADIREQGTTRWGRMGRIGAI